MRGPRGIPAAATRIDLCCTLGKESLKRPPALALRVCGRVGGLVTAAGRDGTNVAPMTRRVRYPHLRVTVCGTFNLGLPAVAAAVEYFRAAGVTVLSPADPVPAEILNGFLYVASDRHRLPELVEERHVQCALASDFLWLVAPDGYVGVSAAVEVTHAFNNGVPIYTVDEVREPAVSPLVRRVPSVEAVLHVHRRRSSREPAKPVLLVDPDAGADELHAGISRVHDALSSPRAAGANVVSAIAGDVRRALSGI